MISVIIKTTAVIAVISYGIYTPLVNLIAGRIANA